MTPTNRLGNWYGNLFQVGPRKLVLCVSESTLLPVLLRGRTAEFPRTFTDELGKVLAGIGVPAAVVAEETAASEIAHFAKTSDRSVLGSMNDIMQVAKHWLRDREDLQETSLKLANMPSLVMDAVFPSEAARAALGLPAGEWRRRPSA